MKMEIIVKIKNNDGSETIKPVVVDTEIPGYDEEVFVWRPYRIILDWYHLKKKCQERLSMAMRGHEIRNEVLTKILQFLWLGKVEKAFEYLKTLDNGKKRNKEHIEKLIAYLDRNFSYIPCYALRKKLGLRVSSNRGEKANDLVVAQRQKHNGMSWSKTGSSGLANVSALFLNKENENRINKRTIEFRLCHNDIKYSAA